MDCHIDVYVTDFHFEEEMGNVSYCFIIVSCCVLQICCSSCWYFDIKLTCGKVICLSPDRLPTSYKLY